MRKLVLVLTMVALSVGIALAAVSWKSGPTFEVTAVTPATWHSEGDGSGFGNQPAIATITATGTAKYTCQNKGGNQAPGINPVTGTSACTAAIQADHFGRGSYSVTCTYTPAATVNGATAGCPNGNWTGINPVVQGTPSAVLGITQAGSAIFGPTASCVADAIKNCL